MPHIPFNKPAFNGREIEYILRALDNQHISGNGEFTRFAEDALLQLVGSRNLLTTSCSHALELAAKLLDFVSGEEIIVPSYTFVTSASSFALHGATPVFVDVDDQTLNIDPRDILRVITRKTRAICVVHYAGVAAPMDEILEIAKTYSLTVIEDNAHGLGGKYRDETLGSLGTFGTHSFHETKNITCGEGGSLVVNDNDYIERAEILREKGTNRSRFLRNQVDKYTWCDLGSSWVMSDLLAAVLLAQLERFELISNHRQSIYSLYSSSLSDWAAKLSIRTPFIPTYATHTAHMYFLRFPTLEKRTKFIQHLAEHDINSVFHYQALHQSGYGKSFPRSSNELAVSEAASDCLVRLPLFNSMSVEQTHSVIDRCLSFVY
jgi:dTDP-4-amino-4,6-dideoxygalactose transaminase